MPPEDVAQTSRYCRKCGYQLLGLSETRCPECGQAFDPADRRTFLRRPRSWLVRRRIRRLLQATGVLVLLALIVVLGGPAYVYWKYHAGWQTEQESLAALQTIGVWASRRSRQMIRLPSPLPDRFTTSVNYLRDRIQYINADRKTLTAADLTHLATFKQVRELRLVRTAVGDDDLAHLGNLVHLAHLYLSGNPRITDAGLAHLTALSHLRTLWLGDTGISGRGLKQLQQLKGLESLDLGGTQVTDGDLAGLKAFASLRTLHLQGLPITDDGLKYLKSLPLTILDLQGTKVTDAGLVHLNALPLRTLMLRKTRITDAGLAQVAQMGALMDLDLCETKVTDAGLAELVALKNLQRLLLVGTAVTPQGVQTLREAMPHLVIQG